MKKTLFILLLFVGFNIFSQIKFEKGYIIFNNDKKIDCLIKNDGWLNIPKRIVYKISENDERIELSTDEVGKLKSMMKYNLNDF